MRFSYYTGGWRLCIVLLACLMLAACGDKEPEQRKAFIEALEKNILSQKGLPIAQLTDNEKKKVGPYSGHYDLLLRSSVFDRETLYKDLNSATEILDKTIGITDPAKRKELLHKASELISNVKKEVQKELSALHQEKEKLVQKDDLKAVYNKAYDKVITTPASSALQGFEHMTALLSKVAELNELVLVHPDKLSYEGSSILVKDETMSPHVEKNLKEQHALEKRLLEHEKQIQELLHGTRKTD